MPFEQVVDDYRAIFLKLSGASASGAYRGDSLPLPCLTRKELRKKSHHHLAVFQHVRHTGRRTQIVFEHEILAARRTGIGTHQINPGDMRVDIARHIDTNHLLAELRIAKNLL